MSAELEDAASQVSREKGRHGRAGAPTPPARGEGPSRSNHSGASWCAHQVVGWWQRARRWALANTVAPGWLPRFAREPAFAYLGAALLQGVGVGTTILLCHLFPWFAFVILPSVLCLVLTALVWGAAPGLFGMVLSCLLTEVVLLPPRYSLALTSKDEMSLLFLLLVGCFISLVANQTRTERKHLEEALRQSEREAAAHANQLEVVFEAIADGVFIYDREGGLVQVNHAGSALLGLGVDPGFRSRPHAERARLLAVRDAEGKALSQERDPIVRLLRGDVLMGAQALDVQLQTRDGRELVVSISGAPIHDDQRQIVGGVSVLRDVTERRKLEQRTHRTLSTLLAMAEALVQSPDERMAPVTETAPAPSLAAYRLAELVGQVLDCQGVSLAALDVAQHTSIPLASLGLPPELEQRWWAGERYSMRWLDTQPALVARLQAGETLVLDARQPPLQREPNPFEVQSFLAVPMRISEHLVGLLIIDPMRTTYHYSPEEIALAEATGKLGALVIERERLRQEREEARANELALREANRQMDAFLGMASHELKTPLTTVILGLQLAERRLQNLLQQQAGEAADPHKGTKLLLEHLRRTGCQASRLDRLVNDLLEVSRIQEGKLDLRLEQANLVALAREIVEELHQATPERAITLRRGEGRYVPVLVDVDRVGQVVLNYLTNALKYSAEDCPVEVEVEAEDNVACVRVRDRGPGIPFAEQERVWERFHRVPGIEVQSGSGIGLGLGLHISQTIIERHGGRVGVESTPGVGSTFWFTLPLARP